MKINLRFIGSLALKTRSHKIEFELAASTTLAEAVKQIFRTYKLGNIEIDGSEFSVAYVRVFLNGRRASIDEVLKEDDEISFFPPMAGG